MTTLFALFVLAALFFIWGMLTIKNEIFPYNLIRYLWGKFGKGSSPYHKHRKSLFEVIDRPADVVMIGDSITNGCEWQEFFPDIRVANRGINSDTTALVLQRMEGILKTRASKAFLMIGVNDLANYTPVEAILKNINAIVEQLHGRDMQVYMQSVLHVGPKYARLNPKITQLNKQLAALADHHDIPFIDLNPALSSGGRLKPEFSEDDIHIGGAGYLAWVDAIRPYLSESPR